MGFPIDIINPQAAIYLTVQCPWKGKSVNGSNVLETQQMVTAFLLDTCKIAIVPFKAFGSSDDSDWYRISVGTLEKIMSMPSFPAFKRNGAIGS